MVKSVYIHIPFCKSKCHYCSFVSFIKPDLKTKYLIALEKSINNDYKNEALNTLYFGGGTPSVLDINEFDNIVRHFNINSQTEITSELNPEGNGKYTSKGSGLGYDYLKALYDVGINRISLGCQTFDNKTLKLLNRRHDSNEVIKSVSDAKKAGFDNISLDFIYGLPDQNIEKFLDDLKIAVDLGVKHISFYGLTIDENCYFYKNPPKFLPDEDEQADMYIAGLEFLKANGFEHYEISNFSLPGYNSKHNLNYWNNGEYYGFGAGAHGYRDGIRYSNKSSLEEYIKNSLEYEQSSKLTYGNQLEEEIFLGLRKLSGININHINSKFNIDFEQKYMAVLKKYESLKLMIKTENGYALTLNGILVSNTIFADFLEDD